MTIGTQSAAPPGAAPASIPAGLSARPGDAPVTHDVFASLVAQLSAGASVGRARGARAPAPTAAPGGGEPFPVRSACASGRPASNDGTPASNPDAPSDPCRTDDTGSAPIDTIALVSGAAADPSTAVPAWLWVLSDPGAPPAADVTTAVGTGTDDPDATSAQATAPDRFTSASLVDRIALDHANRPGPPFSTPPPASSANRSTGHPEPATTRDLANIAETDSASAGERLQRLSGQSMFEHGSRDDTPMLADRASATEAAAPFHVAHGAADVAADATVAQAAAPDRFALDLAYRSNTPPGTLAAEASWPSGPSGQPAPLAARDLANLTATDPAWAFEHRQSPSNPGVSDRTSRDEALRLARQAIAAATAAPVHVARVAGDVATAGAVDKGNDSTDDGVAGVPAPAPSSSAARVTGPAQAHFGGLPSGAFSPGDVDRGASSVPAHADGDPTAAQAVAPERLASTRFADRIALDRSNRSGPPFSTPPPATWANGSTGHPAPLTPRDLANVTATDPAPASEHRQSPAGSSVSGRASRDEAQMLAGRAFDAAAAAPSPVEHGASAAALLVEVVGAGALQTGAPASTPILGTAGAPIAIPDEGDLRHQIIQGITFQWRDGVGNVKVTLHPQYLGEISIALRVDQGGVTAHLSADAASVRAWAAANEASLRQGLAEQGLALSRLVVTDNAPESTPDRESRRRAPQQDTPEPPAPRRTDDGATFEIVL